MFFLRDTKSPRNWEPSKEERKGEQESKTRSSFRTLNYEIVSVTVCLLFDYCLILLISNLLWSMPTYSSTFSMLIVKLLWMYRDALAEMHVFKNSATFLPMLLPHSDLACSSISWSFYGGHRVINIGQIGYHVTKGCKEML
jgi:hypothetical protein